MSGTTIKTELETKMKRITDTNSSKNTTKDKITLESPQTEKRTLAQKTQK